MTVRRKRISNIQYKISLADLQSSLSPYLKLNELDYARFMKAVKISTEHPLITLEKLKLVNPHKVNGTYTADDYGKLLAQHFNTEYIHLDPMKIDHSVIGSLIHKAYLSRLQILPISATKKEVVFAICDPKFLFWERFNLLQKMILQKFFVLISCSPFRHFLFSSKRIITS